MNEFQFRRFKSLARRRRLPAITLLLAAIILSVSAVLASAPTRSPARQSSPCPRQSGQPYSSQAFLSCSGEWVATRLSTETDALTMVPGSPEKLYAGTVNGVRLSQDGGKTWTQVPGPLGTQSVMSFASEPVSTQLFAGSDTGGVYQLSANHSQQWQRVGSPSRGAPIFALAASPHGGDVVLAGSIGGIFRGTRTGSTWQWQQVARTGDSSVPAITWAPWNPHQVFASVFGTSPAVLASSDDGRTWHPYGAGLPATLPAETLLPLRADSSVMLTTMGAGVWVLHANGIWHDVSAGLPQRHAMPAIDDATAKAQFAGTMGYGVYVRQQANAWRRLGHRLAGTEYTVLSLILTSGPEPQLFAGTARGLFRFSLNGK
ncbi:MAG: glycosyl hydrolase, repeat-containing protein [Chloroflexi bacterium]|jgi:hypothetical protein|nr:glycosyl hydrolase, repeat-containing protein [Chloroflexota bacterium]